MKPRDSSSDSTSTADFRLSPGPDLADDVERLIESVGERIGLRWSSLSRPLGRHRWSSRPRPGTHRAHPVRRSAPAASYGFRWRLLDSLTLRWWPQGITTSADACDSGAFNGRELVVVSWYAKGIRGRNPGVRLSFVDVTDRSRPTYRHVLLVEPVSDDSTGLVEPCPVRVHAGGIVWFGSTIWVADTYGGFRLFDVGDVVRLSGEEMAGHRYVLPQRTTYRCVTDEGAERFRFSFVSLDRGSAGDRSSASPELVTGEYGDAASSRRVARFRLDPTTGRLAVADGFARPTEVLADGPVRMQGVVSMGGRQYVSTSNGRRHRGSLWTRKPGDTAEDRGTVLAVGPEDLAYWPEHDELWNLSEHPLRRYVYAMPRGQFD